MNAAQRRKAARYVRRAMGDPGITVDDALARMRRWAYAATNRRWRLIAVRRSPPCAACGGSGCVPGTDVYTCRVCWGNGYLPAPPTRRQRQRARRTPTIT